MEFYLAPMEGITGYIYRNVLRKHFAMPEKCFTPFIAPNQNRCMNGRELRDVLPENNKEINVVPQILTNKAEQFVATAMELNELGYGEVNLNLGCPSGTVVAKKRGSGFLAVLEELDVFLEQIFEKAPVKISIKTRIGIREEEEFYRILEIYNKYPLEELIIHPRLQQDFYKNQPHMDIFKEALQISKHDICYNGDLFTQKVIEDFAGMFPSVEKVMLGRGLLVNPGLLNQMRGQEVTKEQLKDFHDTLLEEYAKELYGDKSLLFKMKELWFYLIHSFEDHEKVEKKIKKAQKLLEYQQIVEEMFEEKTLRSWR